MRSQTDCDRLFIVIQPIKKLQNNKVRNKDRDSPGYKKIPIAREDIIESKNNKTG